MQNLRCVSLTGADDTVSPDSLAELSAKFPLVEWAILSSASRSGTNRYPSDDWVTRFHKACPLARKAIHLCGKDVDAFLAKDAAVLNKVSKFDRIQLNFNHRRNPVNLDTLIDVANSVPQIIILQHNSANESLHEALHGQIVNMQMLFDSSGGRGVSPSGDWPEPLSLTVCGYAGNLGPDNIAEELVRIRSAVRSHYFWIDMESKLRAKSDDSFDRDACESVLSIAYGQILKSF